MNDKSENDSPYILLVIGVFAVSTAAILIKLSLAVASPIAIAFYRMAFSAVMAIIVLLIKPKQKKEKLDKSTIWLLILSGILLAAHFALWTWSLDLVSVNSSVILRQLRRFGLAYCRHYCKERVLKDFIWEFSLPLAVC